MAVTVPQSVRDAWGDQVSEDVSRWIEQMVIEHAVPRDEYRQVLSRLDILEHDVADLKVEVRELRREMNERFDRMNERFDRMNERFDKIGERFDQMYERMLVMIRWTVGTIVLFGTAVTILLAIAQFGT